MPPRACEPPKNQKTEKNKTPTGLDLFLKTKNRTEPDQILRLGFVRGPDQAGLARNITVILRID